jgi:N6-adenosine-specific RNA methylase IME4
MNKFNIILADPPWTYNDKGHSGQRGSEYKYKCMSIYEIQRLRVEEIAAENSVLFLWVTFPMLQEGLDTLKAWGFKYKTAAFVWVKTNKNLLSWFMGMGNWTRANAEIVLLGTRGKPERVNASIKQIVEGCRGAHSEKPQEVRHRIEALCGDLPRIELFATSHAEGWVSVGDKVSGKDIRQQLKEIIGG